jgi:hypothetical protein
LSWNKGNDWGPIGFDGEQKPYQSPLRIECVPSPDFVYAALDRISVSLRRMLGAKYYTISATANLFPIEVTLTLTLSPTFPFLTNITKPCIRAMPSPLSLLSVT